MIRLILLAVLFCLGYTLYTLWTRTFGGGHRPSGAPPDRRDLRRGEEMVQDAYDGSYVAQSLAVTLREGGRTLYFANADNRDAYLRRKKQG